MPSSWSSHVTRNRLLNQNLRELQGRVVTTSQQSHQDTRGPTCRHAELSQLNLKSVEALHLHGYEYRTGSRVVLTYAFQMTCCLALATASQLGSCLALIFMPSLRKGNKPSLTLRGFEEQAVQIGLYRHDPEHPKISIKPRYIELGNQE